MEWGKFPIYLTLKRINIFFAITWFCHSDEYQWEMVSYVIQMTARSKNLLFCAHRRRAFISHCHQHLSFRCFPFKYPYGLWQAIRTVVQSAWHSCAKGLSQSCQRRGTSMPKGWHEQSIPSTPRPLCFLCPPDGAFAKMRYILQKACLQKDSLSNSQTGITAWYGWQ